MTKAAGYKSAAIGVAAWLVALTFLYFVGVGASVSYDISLAIKEDGAYTGSETVSGIATGDWQEVVLRLYPDTAATPRLKPLSVKLNGEEKDWRVDGTVLSLPADLSQGEAFRLAIDFSGQLPPFAAVPGYGIFARADNAMTLSQCYPLLAPWRGEWLVEPVYPWGDALVADVADYHAEIKVPPGWQVVARGTEVKHGESEFIVTGDNLRELGLVVLRGYRLTSHRLGQVTVRSFYLPRHRRAAERALEVASDALSLYENRFGPYPWPELDVVEVPLHEAGGMEYPGLVLAGQDYYPRYLSSSFFFTMIFAHEVAHQWWYAQVGNDQVAAPWLDEALATFSSGLYFESVGKLDDILAYWRRSFRLGQERNPAAAVDSPLSEFPDGTGYGGIVYSGGALMLAELRSNMGDGAFFSALGDYLERFRWKLATGLDLISALRRHSPVPLGSILEKYLKYYQPAKLVFAG